MPEFRTRRLVRHAASQMFDLVADVGSYPEFVPLCSDMRIRSRTTRPDGKEVVVAVMTLVCPIPCQAHSESKYGQARKTLCQ